MPGDSIAGIERVRGVTRQNRNVVPLHWIKGHLAGVDGRFLCAGLANAIADIAHGLHTQDALPRFAGYSAARRPHTAGRNDRHVTGVEIDPKDWEEGTSHSSGDARSAC